jgi:hypothetical protein
VRQALVLGVATLLLAGCGGPTTVVAGDPVKSPYDGPMSLPIDHADEATVLEGSGAAGRALECSGSPHSGGGAAYDDGLASVQDSAAGALANLFEEDYVGDLPQDGYRIEREDDHRVLLSYDVADQTKVAFVAFENVKDFNGDVGWGVETWAACDPSEFPASVTDTLGIQVWEDAAGRRVPLTRIQSFQGAEHCGWQDITFLHLGPERDSVEYVRDRSGELAELLRTTYDGSATLPTSASSTGLRRDGRELWLDAGHNAAYLVSLRDATDVERWPASNEPIRCA